MSYNVSASDAHCIMYKVFTTKVAFLFTIQKLFFNNNSLQIGENLEIKKKSTPAHTLHRRQHHNKNGENLGVVM